MLKYNALRFLPVEIQVDLLGSDNSHQKIVGVQRLSPLTGDCAIRHGFNLLLRRHEHSRTLRATSPVNVKGASCLFGPMNATKGIVEYTIKWIFFVKLNKVNNGGLTGLYLAFQP